jgi:chemotaxis-related protein WspB
MLDLIFYLGDVVYAIPGEKVREVVPVVKLKTVAHAPDFFAGFFNYRGEFVPVIDLRRLIQEESCRLRLSSRIILVDYLGVDRSYIVGLMAERVTDVIRTARDQFASPGFHFQNEPYLRGILMEAGEIIRQVDLDSLADSIGFLPPPPIEYLR